MRANCFHKSYKWSTTADDDFWKVCSSSQTQLAQLMTEEVRNIMTQQQNTNADIPEKELEALLNEQE